MKRCSKCGETKAVNEFYKNSANSDGYQYWCISCSKASNKQWIADNKVHNQKKNKAWREKNAEKVAADKITWQLKKHYNLTNEQYVAMLSEQGGVCAICSTDDPGGRFNRFCVDHDHTTGRIRGLLCNNCNRGIGMLKDDADVLDSASRYLRKY